MEELPVNKMEIINIVKRSSSKCDIVRMDIVRIIVEVIRAIKATEI